MAVHNHGTEEGKGLSCQEVLINGELKGECMPDSLRDRIANILYQELSVELPAAIRGADAVIAALPELQRLEQWKSQPRLPFQGDSIFRSASQTKQFKTYTCGCAPIFPVADDATEDWHGKAGPSE